MDYETGIRLDIIERKTDNIDKKINYLIEKLVPEEVEVVKEK